MISTNWSFGI